MRPFILIVFLILSNLLAVNSFAQEATNKNLVSEQLSPIGTGFGMLKLYNRKIQEVLCDEISDFQIIQFMSQPSLGKESVLAIEIEKNDEVNKFSIVYHQSSSSIWSSVINNRKDKIVVEKYRKIILEKDALKISQLYNSALSKVCQNSESGLDGNTYIFSNMAYSGKVWVGTNLNPENKLHRLILLSHEFEELTKDPGDVFKLDDVLVQEIEELKSKFD